MKFNILCILMTFLITGCSKAPGYKVGDCLKLKYDWDYYKVVEIGKHSYKVINDGGHSSILVADFSDYDMSYPVDCWDRFDKIKK